MLVIIGFFYAGQGYSLGSLVLLLPLYMLNELQVASRSEAISLAALIIFPWYFKFIFGMITDNFPIKFRRRKPYLVFATLFSLAGWTSLGIPNSVYPWFLLSGISLAIGSAMGDAVIDGQSIEITPDNYAGRLQGINWGSRGLGLGAAGFISSNIIDIYGWDVLFSIAGFFGVTITVVTLILPEIHQKKLAEKPKKDRVIELFSQIKRILTKQRTRSRVAYFLFSGFTLSIILQLTLIMETEFGYDFNQIGTGALSFAIGTFLGAIVNGILTDKEDNFQGFVGLSIAYGTAILAGSIFVTYRDPNLELVFFFFIGLFGGAYEAYQLKVIQEETAENLESTIFAIYTGISNVGQFAMGAILIVILADQFGFSILYSMQIVLLILVVAGYFLYILKFKE